MSLPWVRQQYGVPATRGGIVRFSGREGRILSATHHLHLRMEEGTHVWVHPKWNVEYQLCAEDFIDRHGVECSCPRPAVGYRYDPEYPGDGPYPVCRRHHRPPFDPEPVDCPACQGMGHIQYGWGRHKRTETCDECSGNGVVEPCQ